MLQQITDPEVKSESPQIELDLLAGVPRQPTQLEIFHDSPSFDIVTRITSEIINNNYQRVAYNGDRIISIDTLADWNEMFGKYYRITERDPWNFHYSHVIGKNPLDSLENYKKYLKNPKYRKKKKPVVTFNLKLANMEDFVDILDVNPEDLLFDDYWAKTPNLLDQLLRYDW